jgi:hypothetical protein
MCRQGLGLKKNKRKVRVGGVAFYKQATPTGVEKAVRGVGCEQFSETVLSGEGALREWFEWVI